MGDPPEDEETERLLERVAAGDPSALNELLERHRPLMRRVVGARLDARLLPRVDPSDVVQEALMEATRRIRDFLDRRPMPFRLWLRQTTFENLLRLHRRHVAAERRSVSREFPLSDGSSLALGRQLLAQGPAPDAQLLDEELSQRVREALAELSETDREVLLMRVFEGFSNQEVAAALGLETSAASQRFGRALIRLRARLGGGGDADGDE